MDVYDEFGTDETLEVEGVWIDYDDKTKFRIARANNPQFVRMFTDMQRRNRQALRAKGKASDELSKRIMIEIFAKTILLGWSGPVFLKGEDLSTYSFENAKKVLEAKGFRAWVAEQADDEANFKAQADEAAAKN